MDTSHLTKLYTHEEIQKKITELANKINKEYKNDETIVVGILNGAFMFTSDLMKEVKIRTLVDFIGTSSYENNIKTDKIRFTKKLKYDIKDKDVIIIEDILDSGHSLDFILDYLYELKPRSVKIFVLLGRKDTEFNRVNKIVDYFWKFNNKDYVVGYGFDDKEYLRQLQDIYYINSRREEWMKLEKEKSC